MNRTIDAMKRKMLIVVITLLFCSVVYSQQLILRGDYPDPSVTKIGNTYWASATTSNWAPIFPLLQSKDLEHWNLVSTVFKDLPAWADYYFWAPEISYDKGRVYVYYAAHKKNGNLCVSVASADKPEGPYKDHGPLMCQEDGSIDAFPMRDENGKLYLIWKEDANSIGKPTPIWAMQMNEERTALLGEKKELFRNTESWEGNLVEGVSMIKHGDYFYAIYAAAGCCGGGCTYATGVARSKSLLGPWEKYKNNPVLTANEQWKCPGHGTPIEKNGRYYFLHHAYNKQSSVYTGREGMLSEFKFTHDGWIEFVKEEHHGNSSALKNIVDEFNGKSLSLDWEWSVFQKPKVQLKGGEIYLGAMPSSSGTFIAQKTLSGNYTATAKIDTRKSTAASGIAAIGDEKNIVYALYANDVVKVIQLKDGKESELDRKSISKTQRLYLRMNVQNGKDVQFFFSTTGSSFKPLNDKVVDGSFLPPWDRAVRIGLIAKGTEGTNGVFDRFEVVY